ncbi:MAG: SDR family oxidoreductase [Elusimicrobia bacterium]|nr:SDR family oxidoreductase [Elusimicrobiota bacterium]
MARKILLTGHNGYVGSIMAPMMQDHGFDVVGLDTCYYGDCSLAPDLADVPTVRRDIRDVEAADLRGYDAVVHLAALSNDFIGNLNPRWTDEINFRASLRLAELAKKAGVPRFLFSSSCIMYGTSDAAVVTEESPLDPKTDYARSKVQSEEAIARLADDGFSPTFLRNGTIYGLSPRMRFDTVLNNLVGSAVATGKVVVHGDGQPWRPVAHVRDVARAFIRVLEAPREVVHNQAFNNGEDRMNHQIIRLAEIAVAAVPGSELVKLGSPDADKRTYKTDFSKFARTFPDFRFERSPADGARELCQALRGVKLDPDGFTDRRFTRLKWLRHLLDTGRLDGSLRWQDRLTPARA